MTKPVVDPWLLDAAGNPDPFAQSIDFGMTHKDEIDPDLSLDQHEGLEPEVIMPSLPSAEPVTVPVEPAPLVPVEPPEPEGPEVMEIEDGTQLALEKDRGQWKGTVSTVGGGSPQVYWGKTKNELIFNVLKAQANATKKIREQNLRLKLGPAARPAPVSAPSPATVPTALSADEIFELKTQFEANPDVALETWFQKKTGGRTISQLVEQAERGAAAEANLETDSICQTFLRRNPDYYPDDTNFDRIIQWIGKFKAGTAVPAGPNGMYKLYYSGHWTVENLEDAFTDLSNDGLLVKAPKPVAPQTPPPVQVQQEPAPAPRPDDRIVQTVTRPRAALGIRTSDVTPVAVPETPVAPSVEDLDKLSDEAVRQLLGKIRQEKAKARRY